MKYFRLLFIVLLAAAVILPLSVVVAQDSANADAALAIVEGVYGSTFPDFDRLEAYYSDVHLYHAPDNTTMTCYFHQNDPSVWDAYTAYGRDLRRAYRDLAVSPEMVIEEGNLVIVQITWTGTNILTAEDEMLDGLFVFRLNEGSVAEEWFYLYDDVPEYPAGSSYPF